MSDNSTVVTAQGLTKVFKDFWGRPKVRAVDNVDFDIRRGEVFGLIGPNGAGKSTIVKMILGLLYPTKGRLSVLGESPRSVRAKSRIGYLPEESYLYRYLSADETLSFFGRLFDLESSVRGDRNTQLLEMVGLSHVRNRRVGEFSKGMMRRIGIAQALINDPEFVVLDEPTSGLDPISCREVKNLIQHLSRRGKTVLLSSHLLSDVEDVCDRVLILYNGQVQAYGPIQELLARPDVITVTAPASARESLQQIVHQISAEAGEDAVTISTPTRSLESFFMEVVNRARKQSPAASGAAAGGPVADYLSAPAEEESPEAVLAGLLGAPSAPEGGDGDESESQPPAPPAEEVDREALESLVASDDTEQEADQPAPEQPAAEPQPEADSALLDALTGNADDAEESE